MLEKDCIFCKIIKGEIPCHKVFENDKVLAFLDINPIHDGHTLAIPKKHYPDLPHMEKEDLHALIEAVQKLLPVIKKAVNADGINVGLNSGVAAGQLIGHAHFHIIPRYKDDALRSWTRPTKTEPEFESVLKKIKKALK